MDCNPSGQTTEKSGLRPSRSASKLEAAALWDEPSLLTGCSQYENITCRTLLHVISRKALVQFTNTHPDVEVALDVWYRIAKRAQWKNLVEVKKVYPQADLVGRLTVFNIKGNKYRLIAEINYNSQTIFVRYVLTHKDYERGDWKK